MRSPGLSDVADAASFLHQVEDDSVTLPGDQPEGAFELFPAVAVAAAQGFARNAGRVKAGVEGRRRRDVSVREGDDIVTINQVLKDVRPEDTEARLEIAGGDEQGVPVQRMITGDGRAGGGAAGMLQPFDQGGEFRAPPPGAGRGDRRRGRRLGRLRHAETGE